MIRRLLCRLGIHRFDPWPCPSAIDRMSDEQFHRLLYLAGYHVLPPEPSRPPETDVQRLEWLTSSGYQPGTAVMEADAAEGTHPVTTLPSGATYLLIAATEPRSATQDGASS